jgi:hypothetical protein
MDHGPYQEWHFYFFQAMLEPIDSPDLSRRVKEAEMAISQRLDELRWSANGNQERQDMAAAFANLQHLRDEGMMHSSVAKNGAARAC